MIITIIGSRNTPTFYVDKLKYLALKALSEGHTIRSGNAKGADSAVSYAGMVAPEPVKQRVEVYLPWKGFGPTLPDGMVHITGSDLEAQKLAAQVHPAWERCSASVKKLHTRNIHQVLGKNRDQPSDLVVFYAPEKDGRVQGGTATAINLAIQRGIRVKNFWTPNSLS